MKRGSAVRQEYWTNHGAGDALSWWAEDIADTLCRIEGIEEVEQEKPTYTLSEATTHLIVTALRSEARSMTGRQGRAGSLYGKDSELYELYGEHASQLRYYADSLEVGATIIGADFRHANP